MGGWGGLQGRDESKDDRKQESLRLSASHKVSVFTSPAGLLFFFLLQFIGLFFADNLQEVIQPVAERVENTDANFILYFDFFAVFRDNIIINIQCLTVASEVFILLKYGYSFAQKHIWRFLHNDEGDWHQKAAVASSA